MPPYYVGFVLGAYLQPLIQALPQVSFPIAEQIPPAGVVDQKFYFTFSPQTFVSADVLEYSLPTSPSWLRLDGSTRTLSGTPSRADVGTIQVQIQAADREGSTTTGFSLSVLASNSLEAQQHVMLDGLNQAGAVSAPSTLLLYPQTDFSLVFGPKVFDADVHDLHYYASSDGNTPLPAWIRFDAATVSFSGQTPNLLTRESSPQAFGFSLAAGQALGVSQASFKFQISVANHVLHFLNSSQSFEITPNEKFSIKPMLQFLQRDGSTIDATAISHWSSNQPAWLSLKPEDLSFAGTVPSSPENTQFELSVTDDQNNVAVARFNLHSSNVSSESPQRVYLQTVDAVKNQTFVYTFNVTAQLRAPYDVEADVSGAKSWLLWIPDNATIKGLVPVDEQTASVLVTITIRKDAQMKEVLYLPINVVDNAATKHPEDPSETQNPTNSSIPNGVGETTNQGGPEHNADNKALALKIALPLLVAAVLLSVILLLLRYMRRKRHRGTTAGAVGQITDSPRSSNIMQESSSGNVVVVGQSPRSESLRSFLASSPPPRVDFAWSSHRGPLSRLFSLSSRDGRNTPTTRSSWSDMLNEVESPTVYGHYNMVAEPCDTSVGNNLLTAPVKAKYSIRRITRGAEIQKSSAPTSTSRFNGRRRSGLGHGTSYGESDSMANHSTLRHVPLSPLTESPVAEQISSTIMGNHRFPRNGTSSRSTTRSKAKLESISGSSRYDDPNMESTLDSYDGPEESDSSSKPAPHHWDDRDWQTMSNLSDGSSRRNNSVGGQARRGPAGSRAALPFSFSNEISTLGQQSQSNSLRFI